MGIGMTLGIGWGSTALSGEIPEVETAFVFTVQTDNVGTSAANQFTIPTTGTGYNYDISTSDGQSINGNTGNTTITFPSAGSYDVNIKGDFPSMFFDNGGDKLKITDIKNWGITAWTGFNRAFYNCSNMTITATDIPNVSAVGSFYFGFRNTAISGAIDLSSWDLSSVGQIGYMFADCTGITSVNLNSLSTNAITSDGVFLNSSNVTIITLPVGFRPTVTRNMFRHMPNLVEVVNIESWNTTSLSLTTYMFAGTPFNQDISGWDVSNMTTMQEIFYGAFAFNQDISSWDVSNVINMASMFYGATTFNQPLNTWNTSSVNIMASMFISANAFNQDLSGWDTSNVTTMREMFLTKGMASSGASGTTALELSLNSWDVSNVTDMYRMFESVNWGNPDITNWNTQSVQNFQRFMQSSSSFNRDLSGWNTSSATNMSAMFGYGNSQPGNISSWDIDQATNFTNFMFGNTGLSIADYDAVLVSWENQLQVAYPGGVGYTPIISINFGVSQYFLGTAAETARTSLINTYGWTITDGGGITDPAFIFEVNTQPNAGFPASTQYTVSTSSGFTYNYNVETSDGQIFTNRTGTTTITFPAVGTYQIKITGTFPKFRSVGGALYNPEKLTRILNWGSSIQWESFNQSFETCKFLTDIPAIDAPDLSLVTDMYQAFATAERLVSINNLGGWDVSSVTDMSYMFFRCYDFNEPGIASWDTSSVTNMAYMFYDANDFNQPIGSWDVSSVTNMEFMFYSTNTFNNGGSPDINNWNTINVTNMSRMFQSTNSFNQPIGNWNVSSVTNMNEMFYFAQPFNQPIGNWDVSSVTNMQYMFQNARDFNNGGSPDINNWNTISVTNMVGVFSTARAFNQPIGGWDVSSATNMNSMFGNALLFNQPIGGWDVSSVTTMSNMFTSADAFNQPIGSWDVSSVTDMGAMFANNPVFNNGGSPDINNWNTGNVTIMGGMFSFAPNFNQPIGDWNISNVSNFGQFMYRVGGGNSFSSANLDDVYTKWSAQTVNPNLFIEFSGVQYTIAGGQAGRNILTGAPNNWTITDGGGI